MQSVDNDILESNSDTEESRREDAHVWFGDNCSLFFKRPWEKKCWCPAHLDTSFAFSQQKHFSHVLLIHPQYMLIWEDSGHRTRAYCATPASIGRRRRRRTRQAGLQSSWIPPASAGNPNVKLLKKHETTRKTKHTCQYHTADPHHQQLRNCCPRS